MRMIEVKRPDGSTFHTRVCRVDERFIYTGFGTFFKNSGEWIVNREYVLVCPEVHA